MQHNEISNTIINPHGKLPVGVSDFTELVREEFCFVDKTLFIKELLDSGDKISLITLSLIHI